MNQEHITATLSQINGKGLEATFTLGEVALENAQKLAELHYEASKDALVNTQESMKQVLAAKDPKQVTEMLGTDALQAAGNQVAAYQKKVTQVIRNGNKQLSQTVEANIDHMQAGLQDWVDTLTANAPTGSDAFVSSFKTVYGSVMQGYEQFRAVSKEAFVNAEKSADQAINAVQGQIAQVKKAATPATRTRKAA
ncbi:Phasin protein [Polynucleobacter meluiroseus]|uniref:Phasin protein n=1 Tax=Polynucleobacter meluiroseus TaxID=1938814 RepID=A0A240E239_9BURK|nr:phasin family protein [Polynucleobacter meluiroseus]SNX28930.1 Phasin protein [Polynucleobacter meluiroseus]